MQRPQNAIDIEYINHYPIEIYKVSSLYKLNIRLKTKPVILTLSSLAVIKQIINHSEYFKSLLQMESMEELKIVVPGFGVFNQKYELEQIGFFFSNLAEYAADSYLRVQKLCLEMPGWRSFSSEVIKNIFKFIKVCTNLQELTLNLNNIMNLLPIVEEEDREQDTFYDKRSFKSAQFDQLLTSIGNLFVSTNSNGSRFQGNYLLLRKIQLRFAGWLGVDANIIESLAQNLEKMFYRDLKILKLDLSSWGSSSSSIDIKVIQKMFKVLEDFECDYELIEIDMRNWDSKYKIQRYKERFQALSGDFRNGKQDPDPFSGFNSMTGTQFFGSQIKSKLSRPLRVQIKT